MARLGTSIRVPTTSGCVAPPVLRAGGESPGGAAWGGSCGGSSRAARLASLPRVRVAGREVADRRRPAGEVARPRRHRRRRGRAGAADPALLQRPHLRHALRPRPALPRRSRAAAPGSPLRPTAQGGEPPRRRRGARAPGGRSLRRARPGRGRVRPSRAWVVGRCFPRGERPPRSSSARTTRRRWRCSVTTCGRPLRHAAGAERVRRPAPLPLQAARPPAPRSGPARRLGARRAPRDPRGGRGRRPLRPRPAGDRADRQRRRRRAGSGVSSAGPTTIWSSHFTIRSCARGSARSCGGAPGDTTGLAGSATWWSTRHAAGPRSPAERWRSPTRSSRCCGCSPRTRCESSPSRSCWKTSGGSAPRHGRARSTPTPAACAENWTPSTSRFVVNCWGVGYRLVEG